MATGFGAVTFDELYRKPEGNDRAEATEIHVPGGDVTVIDLGGRLASHVQLELHVYSDVDYESLRALVGTQATLTILSGAHTDTLLISLVRTCHANGHSFANADFVVPT